MSASSRRKRERREALRARQRRAGRLGRLAVVCAGLAAAGLLTMVLLLLVSQQDPAAWLAAPSGLLALLATGLLVGQDRVGPRPLTMLGRIGAGLVGVAGLVLVAGAILALAAHDDAAQLLILLAIVPGLFSVTFLGSHWLRGGPDMDGPSVSTMMTDITEFHS